MSSKKFEYTFESLTIPGNRVPGGHEFKVTVIAKDRPEAFLKASRSLPKKGDYVLKNSREIE